MLVTVTSSQVVNDQSAVCFRIKTVLYQSTSGEVARGGTNGAMGYAAPAGVERHAGTRCTHGGEQDGVLGRVVTHAEDRRTVGATRPARRDEKRVKPG